MKSESINYSIFLSEAKQKFANVSRRTFQIFISESVSWLQQCYYYFIEIGSIKGV